jgi:Polyketide cyclase / dehydrase and lipid transport
MATVSATRALAGARAAEAHALWFALDRRPAFVDGFARLDVVEGDWPQAGSRIVWSSPVGGRGRVVEHVTGYEPAAAHTAVVEDGELTGTQTVRMHPIGDGCQITLELTYRLKREDVAGVLADLIFIRRRLRESLRRTLARFAIELAAERELHS